MYSTTKAKCGDSNYVSVNTLIQPKKNQTGLPDQLKTGIENLSGISMENTRVHYNSAKPAELQALAYTRGTDIHIGPGQEIYLPHEAWHVVQQRQGRVYPESQIKGIAANNDWSLEREADLAGAGAAQNGKKYAPLQTPVLQSNAIIQRMEDPDEIIYNTLMRVHNTLRKKYQSYTIPKPSEMVKKIREFIAQATDKENVYQKYAADAVGSYLYGINKSVITGIIKNVEDEVSADKRERDGRLKRIRESESTEKPAKKRTKVPVKMEEYSDSKKADFKKKLKSPGIQQKMFRASTFGYRANRVKSTEAVKQRAELNALTEITKPLSTADMAMAQASYRQGAGGEQALLLEKGPKYKVTMSRSGGQEIHQLGPYLPGGRKRSVQEIIDEILKNTKLSSTEQAEAINIRDPEELLKWVEGKNVSDKYIEKIRAMRHLLAVEKHRGEEVAGATSLEHRSAVHGYRDITEYPERTPLGPPGATVDLKAARAKQLRSEGKKESDVASDFSYVPPSIRARAMESTTHFLTSFMENPKPDPEAEALVEAISKEKEESGEPSQQLVDAFEGVVRTPTYTGFDD